MVSLDNVRGCCWLMGAELGGKISHAFAGEKSSDTPITTLKAMMAEGSGTGRVSRLHNSQRS